MRIAIISTDEDSSPKILRQSLGYMLNKEGVDVVEISDPGFLTRLFPLFGAQKKPGAFHFRLKRKLENYFSDKAIYRKLQWVDAIIFSVQTPNGFWRHEFAIESLRELVNVPVIYHEVYFLGNTPGQQAKLVKNNDFGIERYDWHLAVTPVTGVYTKSEPPWSVVGLNLEESGLYVPENKKMRAIVDFPHPGFKLQRKQVLDVLRKLDFDHIELCEKISMNEIRQIYRESALLFLSSPEAFGVPIAECLSCGTAIFTPEVTWPMSWRLLEGTLEPSGNKLPGDCFWIYQDHTHLEQKLEEFRLRPGGNARNVRDRFLKHYPYFYYGNQTGIKELLSRLERKYFI